MKFPRFRKRTPLVSVVRLEGVIASGGMVRSSALNDAGIAPLIERAFSKGKPSAVALALNSPGGSPVQSSLISGRIRRLSEERKVPVFAFVEDLAASGGYWIACAADEIFVDPSSIVGSIGVISASFGFHDLLKRSGIERRVHTAGEDKSILDPFLPEKESDVSRLEELQSELHRTFIQHVTDRRGEQAFRRRFVHREILDGSAGGRSRLGGRNQLSGPENEREIRGKSEVQDVFAPPEHFCAAGDGIRWLAC